MKSSRVLLIAVLAGIVSASTIFAAAVAQSAPANAAVLARESNSQKEPVSASPALAVLGVLFCGTVLVLVTGTGRESLDSVNFERAYRSSQKTS